MRKLVPCEIHISAQDTQVTPDTDLTLGYSWRVEGHEGHTEEIFLSLQHRHSCSRLCSLTQYLNHCAATNSARWSKLILLTKSYTGWESGMDFPNQHSYWVQDKRSNTKEWLGLGKRREENRAAPLFLAAAQSSEINQNTSPHSSYSPHSSRRKKKSRGDMQSHREHKLELPKPPPTHLWQSWTDPHKRGCKQVSCWLCIIDIWCAKNHNSSKPSRRWW